MKTVRDEYLSLMRDWRQDHPLHAHYSDEQILEVILTNLSKSHPNRVKSIDRDKNGKTIWQILPGALLP